MSRKPNIRWRKRDLETLDRTVRNFNAKLSRLQKKNPDDKYLPQRLSKKELKERIKTRDDFNNLIDLYKSFSVRGMEERVVVDGKPKMTKWAYRQYKKIEAMNNKEKAKKLKSLLEENLYSAGKPLGVKRKELYAGQGKHGRRAMHSIEEVALTQVEKDPLKMSPKEFAVAFNSLERYMLDSTEYKTMLQYKENYLTAMNNEGYSQEMIDFVRTIPAEVMYETGRVDDESLITYVYSKSELALRERTVLRAWSGALNRHNISKSQWIENLKGSDLSDDILESLVNNVGFSNNVWREILTKSNYPAERIKNLLR